MVTEVKKFKNTGQRPSKESRSRQRRRMDNKTEREFMGVVVNVEGEGEVIPVLLTEHPAMKEYWKSGGMAACVLDSGTRWR
jgi:hypothetical protein